jgi:isoleucyl-tRNA synthetase
MDRVFTILAADYVTLEDGSGLVHTAPGHGEEDYQSGLREGLPVYCPVLGNGTYDATVPEWLRGMDVWTANTKVVTHLRDSGHLFFEQKFSHSYPHDWRSKTPTIFRCTEQWFVGVDRGLKVERPGGVRETTLRHAAVDAIDHDVTFVPEWGRNRMRGMVESRPDWCISRQRSWGLPIPAFFTPEGECVMTAAIVRAVAAVVRAKGSDAWYQLPAAELLAAYQPAQDAELPASAKASSPAQWKKGMDILDVWFEAGSSWNSAVRQRGQAFPSDLYLEGSDQHRGWFQLSLLPSLGVTGQTPFKQCFTHGFTVDKDGRKLSKSKGDTLEKLFEDYGVDVLRWWVSSLPYENDVKVDREFFDQAGESYRKVRNTVRFLLSNLFDFKDGHGPDVRTLPPASLDAWIVGEFDALVKTVVEAYRTYQFRDAHQAIYNFCNETLSAVYLAAVKDRMYCDAAGSARRRRTQSAVRHIADGLCRLLAPIMCHTADEAYRAMLGVEAGDQSVSVHLLEFPQPTGLHPDPRWREVIERRGIALAALEREKKALGLDNPLDAGLRLADPGEVLAHFDPVDLADLLGVSRVGIAPAGAGGLPEITVLDLRSEPRCERSWKRDGTVKPRSDGGVLSDRDAAVLGLG